MKIFLTDLINAAFGKHFEHLLSNYPMYTELTNIDVASGKALDEIGEKVNERRIGKPDNLYRLFIKARIIANSSLGRVNELQDALELITGNKNNYIHLFEYNKAIAVYVDLDVTDPEHLSLAKYIKKFIKGAVEAGTMVTFVRPFEDLGPRFRFRDLNESPYVVDTEWSFGDLTDPAVGGKFNYILA